jgi:toxin YoeB
MKLQWAEEAWDDYLWWQANDTKLLRRINEILRDTMRGPFDGLGRPEALRNELSGQWSRRISQEHRLVYRVSGKGNGQVLEILACRFHYKK